ncbi:MerR family transcriptional regulator [Vallicoccus soli]|uniref:MerR family transcriptional regulator n=1 Tax=Vallicoccus soli TaxID=2339232 RepID=A0A3A3Z093_9ACTN|nr:helix-turn-helix domain-containing protein [Vallicoccus soli]RJK97669.1 MerR family transcriptional regulator [Vallicoccus soli]
MEELAELVGMTPRNVRAHQSRGLLDPPEVVGGRAYYGGNHVARLMLVRDLQERGFSLEAIRFVVETPLVYAGLLGPVGPARGGPWEDDAVPLAEGGMDLVRAIRPSLPEELQAAGILRRGEDGSWWTTRALAALGADLHGAGVTHDVVVECHLAAAAAAREVAARVRATQAVTADVLPLALRAFTAGFEAALARHLLEPDDED